MKDLSEGVPLFAKLCSGNGCSEEHFERFLKLPLEHKLALGVNAFESNDYLNVSSLQIGGEIFNGQKLFEYRYCYFDATRWILTGEIRKTWFSRLANLFSVELWVYRVIATSRLR